MSEQSEREAYNEAAREDHEGKEREEMDRPMFTQRDMDAAVQGERETIKAHIISGDFEPSEKTHEQPFNGYSWSYGVFDVASYIDSRGPAPAVDVMAVVREYINATETYDAMAKSLMYSPPKSVTERLDAAFAALRALVSGEAKGEEIKGFADAPMTPKYACSWCNDTHVMSLEDRDVMCTRCPSPCQKCRKGGNGPFCESTPCLCACHSPKSTTPKDSPNA